MTTVDGADAGDHDGRDDDDSGNGDDGDSDGSDDSDHESLGRRHFLFDHGNVLTPSDIHLAQQHSIEVIPSVNVFHYTREGVAPMAGAARDLAMLAEAGVGRVQLDSVFEALCTNSPRI